MSLDVTWPEILLRLLLALLAGGILGLNREARGHAAGLRTTTLVALAAAVVMIQANLLLPSDGKSTDSFASMDVMRLPLGILTGVGFIGGGAILRRGNSVTGVTTAATLWVSTALGLCFGGGQLFLGALATLFGIATLFVMKWIDEQIPRRREASVVFALRPGEQAPDVESLLKPIGGQARFEKQRVVPDLNRIEMNFHLSWHQSGNEDRAAALREAFEQLDLVSLEIRSEDDT